MRDLHHDELASGPRDVVSRILGSLNTTPMRAADYFWIGGVFQDAIFFSFGRSEIRLYLELGGIRKLWTENTQNTAHFRAENSL